MTDPQAPDRRSREPDRRSREKEPLKDFEARLNAARGRDEQGQGQPLVDPTASRAAMGYAFRIGIELAVGLVIGGGLGWLLDQWFGTTPLMLILFFFLGAGAGIRNVFRTAQEINRAQEAGRDLPGEQGAGEQGAKKAGTKDE